MKTKKVLSTAVASALVAAQMAMPVAAADGGSLDVPVTTKTGILRVEVPTDMTIAVDQFEISHAGAQIASGLFDMKNFSEVAVKVEVSSEVELGTGITLAAGKDAVKGNEAWLGVAAQTAASSYNDGTVTDYADLTEANANVATFADGKAEQTFYLEKGTMTTAVEYKMVQPDANNKTVVKPYAQLYELTALTLTTGNEDVELQEKVKEADVYYIKTTAADGIEVKMMKKGSTVAGSDGAFATGNTYYIAAPTATSIANATNGKSYVYAAMDTVGGEAGFIYVGKLSNEKETWTSEDIKKVSITYTITGVTASNYNDVKNDCTYGLYHEPDPVFAATPQGKITVTGLTAKKNYKSITVNGESIEGGDAEWKMDDYDAAKGGNVEIQLGSTWIDWLTAGDLAGKAVDVVITYTDGTTATVPVTFAK